MKIHELICTPVQLARLFTESAPEINDTSVIESASTVNGVTRLVFRTGGGVSEGKFPVVFREPSKPEHLTSDSETFAPISEGTYSPSAISDKISEVMVNPSHNPKKKKSTSVSGGLT